MTATNESLREYYEAYKEVSTDEARARIYAIEFTLKTLGIKVEGINI